MAKDRRASQVLDLIAAKSAIPHSLLLHKSRCRAAVAGNRQLAMYLMHVVLGRTLTEIGDFFGRDRTTVSHACARIEDKRDDARFDEFVSQLETQILTGPAGQDCPPPPAAPSTASRADSPFAAR